MVAQAAKQAELSHCSVSKGSVLKDSFDLLDSTGVIDVFIAASFDHDRSRTVTHYSFRLTSIFRGNRL